jgi:hypothetical protein
MPPGLDHWITTNPDDEFLGPEPFRDDEDEPATEPVVKEIWDNGRYAHLVTFPSGLRCYVQQATSGALVGDWEIHCPGILRGDIFWDGFTSPEKAIDWLLDPERRDW